MDVALLGGSDQVVLYDRPAEGERVVDAGAVPPQDSLRVMRVRGDFAQMGVFRGLGEEFEPLGWLRIRDEAGRLVAWPLLTDDC